MDRWRRETENASPKQDGKKEKRKKTSPKYQEGEELEEPMRTLRLVVRVPLPRVNVAGAHRGGKRGEHGAAHRASGWPGSSS